MFRVICLLALSQFILAEPIHQYQEFDAPKPRAVPSIDIRVNSVGYPLEEHTVQTSDGYILTIHRIPHGRANKDVPNKQVVFLQHGLLCSSNDWIIPGPDKGLAYILADLGYDVWLGNARGNTYSKKHASLSTKSSKFWDFSWHEIGVVDLPAMIDYVLEFTGQSSLHYAGHSQGTTSFFVMASSRPEYNKKIKAMHALAPVAFMSKMGSPFVRLLGPLLGQLGKLTNLLGMNFEFLPSTELLSKGGGLLCNEKSMLKSICSNVLFLIAGFDADNLNATMIPDIVAVTPAGASVNQFIHYAQEVGSGKFRMFDYGLVKNTFKYGHMSPPDYDLGKITAPVILYYGNNDWMAGVPDVKTLSNKLGNLVEAYEVPHKKWNHLDFLWGTQAFDLLYYKVIENMNKFN